MSAAREFHKPGFVGAVWAVATVTLREILRDRVLYNVLITGALLQALSYLASRLTYVREERILLDFGIAGLQISTLAVAILLGSNLLNRERERRTIWLALARPISRAQFIFGKYAGLCAALVLNSTLLALFLVVALSFSMGRSTLNFHSTLAWAVLLSVEQAMLAAAIAVFFSSFAATSVAAILAVGTVLVGSSITQVLFAASKADTRIGAWFLRAVARSVPNFESFHLGTQLTYGLPIALDYLLWSTLYTAAIALGALALSVIVSQKVES